MERLIIHNLGPVDECDIDIENYMVFTGPQASGKSTVAKAFFFFNDLENALRHIFYNRFIKMENNAKSLEELFRSEIRVKFVQVYGDDLIYGKAGFQLKYFYDSEMSISICREEENRSPDAMRVEISDGIIRYIDKVEEWCKSCNDPMELSLNIGFRLTGVLGKTRNVVYIPAGRSVLTSLRSQIDYVYLSMEHNQRDEIDYGMRYFIEMAIKIRSLFENGPKGLYKKSKNSGDLKISENIVERAISLMDNILQGQYRNSSGIDYLDILDSHSIHLSHASSGQQEAVWILNFLYYYFLREESTMFIIEEPESHLFPNAQKLITEFITLVKNGKNSVVLTTHSPFVLGSINNLLYANRVSRMVDIGKLDHIIPKELWLDFDELGAYYIENGKFHNMKDPEYEDIDHGLIDRTSVDINDAYDQMIELKEATNGEV